MNGFVILVLKFKEKLMNKLEGFLALRKSGLPSVPWKEYKEYTELDSNILWTIRSAVSQGNDLNLPRKIGVTAEEAKAFADLLLSTLDKDDLVLYYPYFIAIKSGVIEVSGNRIVIEAVKEDLWNLVTNNNKDITVIFEEDNLRFVGDSEFLTQDELFELIDYCLSIKRKYGDLIIDGKSILLEWSFAYEASINNESMGKPTLIFYEIRTT
jgi:hypothetical protein